MASVIGGKRHVKIFLLYLMQNVHIPLDFVTWNEMVMQTDYVIYLDFAECFHELLDTGLILACPDPDGGEDRYTVSERGRMVAEQMHTELLPSILEESLRCALRYLDFRKQGIRVRCQADPTEEGVRFVCSLEKDNVLLFRTELLLDSMARAEQLEKNFRERPEDIYRGIHSLLSGNVNYLFR